MEPKSEQTSKSLFNIGNQNATSFIKSFFVGGAAGAVALTITAPLERIKILIQLRDSKQSECKGILKCGKYIYKSQGFLSFWRGNFANIIRILPTNAFNFAFKEKYKEYFLENIDKHTEFWKYSIGNIMAGGSAGISCLTIVYPLDFARTRLAADIGEQKYSNFAGIIDCLKKVYRVEGFRGIYRGYTVSSIGIVVYRSAYFGIYDTVCEVMLQDTNNSVYNRFLLAQAVVVVSGFMSYPFDTVRRLIMMQAGRPANQIVYKNAVDCWYTIAKYEGLQGFYKGVLSNVFVGAGSAFILVLYDEIKSVVY